MLRNMPNEGMRAEWSALYAQYRGRLAPNRKSGRELVDYLLKNYRAAEFFDAAAAQLVCQSVYDNVFSREKLPYGCVPQPTTFNVNISGKRVFVGIDLCTGLFHVEDDERLWDDLFAFRGLDARDLDSVFLVAEYVGCLKRFGRLEEVLTRSAAELGQ